MTSDHMFSRRLIVALIRAAFSGGPKVALTMAPMPEGRLLFTLRTGKFKRAAIFLGEHGAPIDQTYSVVLDEYKAAELLRSWFHFIVCVSCVKQMTGEALTPAEADAVELAFDLRRTLLCLGVPDVPPDIFTTDTAELARLMLHLCGAWPDETRTELSRGD